VQTALNTYLNEKYYREYQAVCLLVTGSVSYRLHVTDSICPLQSSYHASRIQLDCSITHTPTSITKPQTYTNYFI